jgi:hypothetical protein
VKTNDLRPRKKFYSEERVGAGLANRRPFLKIGKMMTGSATLPLLPFRAALPQASYPTQV